MENEICFFEFLFIIRKICYLFYIYNVVVKNNYVYKLFCFVDIFDILLIVKMYMNEKGNL